MASEPRSTTAPAQTGCARVLTALLPFTATLTSLLIGVGIGGVAGWVVKPVPKQISYQRTTSLTEIVEVCEPLVLELQSQLTKVVEDGARPGPGRGQGRRDRRAPTEGPRPGGGPVRCRRSELRRGARGRRCPARRVRSPAADAGADRDGLVDQLTRTRERLLVADKDLAEEVAISDLLRDERGRLVDDGLSAPGSGW